MMPMVFEASTELPLKFNEMQNYKWFHVIKAVVMHDIWIFGYEYILSYETCKLTKSNWRVTEKKYIT